MGKPARDEDHVLRANRGSTAKEVWSLEGAIWTAAQMANAPGRTPETCLGHGQAAEVAIGCSICGAIPPHDIRDKSRWARICEARHRLEMQDLHAARGLPSPQRTAAQSKFGERRSLLQ
jgi:hypothetical protein